MTKKNQDQVILVDVEDNPIGTMDKIEAHRDQGKLHRAASVFLFKGSGKSDKKSALELLIQQRSDKKIVGALQWANTCCGNVRPGESYEECARRRLREELGIDESQIKLKKIDKFIYQTPCNDEFSEHEVDTVFIGRYEGEVKPNPDEVKNFNWIDPGELKEKVISDEKKYYVPWLKIMAKRGLFEKFQEL